MPSTLDIFRGNRPDVTPAQVVAGITTGVPIISKLLASFGVWHPSHDQEQALSEALNWAFGLAALLIGGDAVLRVGRNHADAKVHAAALAGGTPFPEMPPGEAPPPIEDELSLDGVPTTDPSVPETAMRPDAPPSEPFEPEPV